MYRFPPAVVFSVAGPEKLLQGWLEVHDVNVYDGTTESRRPQRAASSFGGTLREFQYVC